MKLDLGCGADDLDGYIKLDIIKREHVDIVHDLEVFPWPIEDETFEEVRAWHILEHIEKRKFFNINDDPCVMGELWRILKPEGLLHLGAPYGTTVSYVQDPTHVNPLVDRTFHYFDPRSPLWNFYKTPYQFTCLHLVRDPKTGTFEMMLTKNSKIVND